jgi:hypothetical protein
MSKQTLERQAERAERLADQTVDDELRKNLLEAAKEYREQARQESGHNASGTSKTAHSPTWLDLGAASSEPTRSATGF